MMFLRLTLALVASIAAAASLLAQRADRYTAPRTAFGHPDVQGVWTTGFLTMLERPPGVGTLVASPEQAKVLAAAIRSRLPAVIDPHVQIDDLNELARVKGEYRTSVVVKPTDGRMPLTQAGVDLAAWVETRNTKMFDHPEQRPLQERCMESPGHPPIRAVAPVILLHQIFQTPDLVVIVSEGPLGVRMIHLGGEPPADVLRSVEGYSTGRWDDDTLVAHTTHFRADDPARDVIGRPLLISRDTSITERFTRVSPTELLYQFTVADDSLYPEPWSGEFSLTRHDGRIYEYACHEGNYSMPTVLRGGQAEAARQAGAERERR
jgi:hypothetical protein